MDSKTESGLSIFKKSTRVPVLSLPQASTLQPLHKTT